MFSVHCTVMVSFKIGGVTEKSGKGRLRRIH